MDDMARVDGLVARHFAVSGGELLVGGRPVTELAAEHGTPLFAYDAAVIDRAVRALRSVMPKAVDLHYSVKANPDHRVVRHLLGHGCGMEVASGGELRVALAAGCPAHRVIFAGPGKTDEEIDAALDAGIGELHVESAGELRRIAAAARRRGTVAPVALRVNPAGEVEGGAMRMGGRPSAFGIDEEALEEVVDAALADPAVDLRGLHLYVGTQILDHRVLAAQYAHGLELARALGRRLGRPPATLDLGGGLGIPYLPGEEHLDVAAFGRAVAALMREAAGDPALAGTRVVLEPGRFLVGECGVYLARVLDVKVSRGRRFLVLDGGLNHHLAASGNLGMVIKRNFPVAVVTRLDEPRSGVADIVGPLCTPLDTLARDAAVPEGVVEGDLVGVLQSGAYGRSASPLGFLSHPAPAEAWLVPPDAAGG